MKNYSTQFSAIAAVFCASVGCTAILAGCSATPPEPQESNSSLTAAVAAPVTRYAFELTRPSHSPSELADQLGKLGVSLGAPADGARAALSAAKLDLGSVHAAIGQSVKASHVLGNDAFLVLDEAVTRDTTSATDVGAGPASATFLSAFKGLIERGAVQASGLSTASVRVTHVLQGEAESGKAPVERIKEYVHTVPRVLQGVEVFGAGVQINVHRNGQLARVAVFGPTVSAKLEGSNELPTAAGFSFKQTVDAATADARVKAEYPKAVIKSIGLRYWLPEGETHGIVAPQHLYLITPTAVIDGQVVKARASYVAYSTQDAAAAPTVWPRANPQASGDSRP